MRTISCAAFGGSENRVFMVTAISRLMGGALPSDIDLQRVKHMLLSALPNTMNLIRCFLKNQEAHGAFSRHAVTFNAPCGYCRARPL
jgi:hypothetical protein